VAFALGETIELQDDADVVGQQCDLDLAAQATQAERHHSLPQFRCAADVAAFVKRDSDFKPLVNVALRAEDRSRAPDACGLWCRM